MATQSTLTLFQLADAELRFDIKTEDGGATPQTMTGWALGVHVKRVHDDAVVCSYATSSGIAIGNGDGTDDRATVTVVDTDVKDPPGNGYYWSLWRTDSGSDVVLAYGLCIIKKAAPQ
jgi:hypothetical protein